MPSGQICRLGVFYDGAYVSRAQEYYWHERDIGWLRFAPLHELLLDVAREKEQGMSNYKVVYAAWFQGLYTSPKATEKQLRADRNQHHDLMHAGIEPHFLPMGQQDDVEKGTDVFLAVDALQLGLEGKMDFAVLVTGDGDFVPLVRALMKHGVRVLVAHFDYTDKTGRRTFANPRLCAAANYELNISALEAAKDSKNGFRSLFRKADEWAT